MGVVRVSEDVEVELPQASDEIVNAEGFVGDGFGVGGEGECRDDAEEKENNGKDFHYFILLFFFVTQNDLLFLIRKEYLI